jgi:hypothetical protein
VDLGKIGEDGKVGELTNEAITSNFESKSVSLKLKNYKVCNSI